MCFAVTDSKFSTKPIFPVNSTITSMKSFPFLLLLGTLAFSAAHADLTIVQQVDSAMNAQATSLTVTTKVKDDKARVDINPQVSTIIDLNTTDSISLFHSGKKAMKIPASVLKSLKQAHAQQVGTMEFTKPLTATGKTETINGFPCEEYDAAVKGAALKVWFTKNAPEAQKALGQLASFANESDPFGAILKQKNLPGFPIKIAVTTNDGKQIVSTVTSLTTTPLPAAEFVIPSDYQEMPLPNKPPGQ